MRTPDTNLRRSPPVAAVVLEALSLPLNRCGSEGQMMLTDDEPDLQFHHWDPDEHPNRSRPNERSETKSCPGFRPVTPMRWSAER